MKRFLTAMMALVMIVTLSQCKKQNEENEDNTAKVRISCTIPINNDDKTDFTNILNGEVNWSAETERIYLALPYSEENHQIVELTSITNTGGKTLTFEGSVEQGLLQNGQHAIWYMGRSQNSKLVDGKVTGRIAEQSGSKDDLGYHHIAKASVIINVDNGITMTFKGKFESQMAIAHLDLTNVAGLSGEAIVGTDYSLEYSEGAYRLKVTGDKDINITGKENKNESYVVLFPTNAKDVELNSDSNKKIIFRNGIKQNALYKENDNKPLIWELPEHECVDLGLPSGVKWATCNIGANSPEAYGKYYAWGETKEPLPIDGYKPSTCKTYNKRMSDISGHETYDAATANWGIGWRIPTEAECKELMDANYCTWSWIEQNNGYLVTSKINGNYIFLPAAGYKSGSTVEIHDGGVYGTYSCSTPAERGNEDVAEKSYNFGFNDETKAIVRIYRENGRVVRPVTGGNFEKPAAQYAEVTTAEVSEITGFTAVCGGNVTVDKYSVVRERGVYYSTSQNPTISDNIKSATPASGEYTVELTGLQLNTTYYVRAYATTDAGTSYGEVKSFTTAKIGVVTLDVTDITRHSAMFNSTVSDISGNYLPSIEWGFYYSTSPNPVETGIRLKGGDWYNIYKENSLNIEDLKPNTTYYVKAYAKYESKEYYGEVKSFTTLDYEYVDLGLPSGTLWATHNVGAITPKEEGNSYKWGAVTTDGSAHNSSYTDISGNSQYDAATANWGDGWRMPTQGQMNELLTECTWEYKTNYNGAKGYKVIGKNQNVIFLPDVGPIHIIDGNYSCYWTSVSFTDGSYALRFKQGGTKEPVLDAGLNRENKCAIRPVKKLN